MSLSRLRAPRRTFIIPVYNAAAFLPETLEKVFAWLDAHPEPWEILLVDDASSDASASVLDAFLAEHPDSNLLRIRFASNRGKGFAVRVGLGMARGEYAVFTDCDLAYPVVNTSRLLRALEGGADAAIACRVLAESTYLISPKFFSYLYTRHIMGRIFNWLCRVLTVPKLLDTQAGLKGFRMEVVRPLIARLVVDGFPFDVEILRGLLDRGAKIVEVPVSFRYDSEPTTVRFIVDALTMVRDLVRIRVRSLRGIYRAPAATPAFQTCLIVHADDFGISPGVDRVIQENLESGAVTSTSLLVGTPHASEALAWAAAHPQFDYGVHLNLTHGRPILPAPQVASLVGPSGEFRPLGAFLRRYLLRRMALDEVRAEMKAQIEAARRAGVRLSHIDSHQHVHLLPRLFSKVYVPLAESEGLVVRMMDGPVRSRGWGFDPKGLALRLASLACLRGASRPRLSARGMGTALMKRPTLAVLRTLMSRMKPGRVYELVVHPGAVDEALSASGDGYLQGRESERELLGSEEFRALIRHAGLRVRSFHQG